MNYIINKAKLAARSLAAIVTLGLLITNLSANEIVVPHSEYETGWESFIMGDTTATGEQNHDVYILESSKVYKQLYRLILNHSVELRGAVRAALRAQLLRVVPGRRLGRRGGERRGGEPG